MLVHMNERDDGYLAVLTTLGSQDEARRLIERLVGEGVIACGTIVPGVVSIYRWEGAVTEAAEALVVMKTRRARWPDLVAAIERWHPYEVPELLACPVELGLEAYLAWVNRETSTGGGGV